MQKTLNQSARSEKKESCYFVNFISHEKMMQQMYIQSISRLELERMKTLPNNPTHLVPAALFTIIHIISLGLLAEQYKQ